MAKKQWPHPNPRIWRTQNGEDTPIRKMTDSHLVNVIRYFKRQAPALLEKYVSDAFSFASCFSGDTMASYYADQDADIAMKMSPDELLEESIPQWENLLEEASRRGLLDFDGEALRK